jgi:hypothetical protein
MLNETVVTTILLKTNAVDKVRRHLRYALRCADDGLLDLDTMEEIAAALRTGLHELETAIYKSDLMENWDIKAALARLS